LYSKALPDENILDLQQKLAAKQLESRVHFQALDLQIHDFGAANYDDAYAHNLKICEDYITKTMPSGSKSKNVWLVPCLMQEPAVPVFPDTPRLLKALIWYDLIPYLLYDHYFKDQQTAYAWSYLKRLNLLPRVDHVFSISAASKNDLIGFLSKPEQAITNIRGSINHELVGPHGGTVPAGVKPPFFLCPASAEPSKNVLNTIKGFGEFNAAHQNAYQLVITSSYDEQLAQLAPTYAKNVIFTGHIGADQLQALYENSAALLFASTYEGLGLPILEAVHFRKKVICSDIFVFQEIEGGAAFYWCQPSVPTSIASALESSIATGAELSTEQKVVYERIERTYSWTRSAHLTLDTLERLEPKPRPTRTIAIVGPHPASFSTIGKVIGESYPYFADSVAVHYYFDSGPSDARHGFVHFHYLKAYEHLYPIDQLPERAKQYSKIIYHMGSSDHHMKTYLLTKAFPGTLVLHDTNLGGKGLAGQMISNAYLSTKRLSIELEIETGFLKKEERFITSLVSSQHKVITHSHFSAKVVKDYYLGEKENIVASNLPIATLPLPDKTITDAPIQLGMVGILAGVKGLDLIEWLFRETDGLQGCELNVFGFGFFANKRRLSELQRKYSNLKVAFDLSNLDYKALLSQLDVLINYRQTYYGETSRSTLESMRDRVVSVVRNIGWYSELPKATCFALDSLDDLPQLVRDFGDDPQKTRERLAPMIAAGQKLLRDKFNFADYIKINLED
jgi:glycosyltransferase involved in cell wall biosynthesis